MTIILRFKVCNIANQQVPSERHVQLQRKKYENNSCSSAPYAPRQARKRTILSLEDSDTTFEYSEIPQQPNSPRICRSIRRNSFPPGTLRTGHAVLPRECTGRTAATPACVLVHLPRVCAPPFAPRATSCSCKPVHRPLNESGARFGAPIRVQSAARALYTRNGHAL
jgi:hypothetical protein